MTENKRIELCPFCGEKEEIEVESYKVDGKDWLYVTCHTCQAQGPASSTEEDAIDMWNWREEE